MAHSLFLKNHSHLNLGWQNKDLLFLEFEHNFKSLCHLKKDHLILLCNLYGQLPQRLMNSSSNQPWLDWKIPFLDTLKKCEFISYHDLFSYTSLIQEKVLNNTAFSTQEEILTAIKDLHKGIHLELIDHMTQHDFDFASKKSYFLWELYPKKYHIIEAVYHHGQR